MNPARAPLVAVMLSLALHVPTVARASGYEVAPQSASAGGTAHAGVARDDDPACAWLNPAATADGAGWRLGIGLVLAAPRVHARALDGTWTAQTQSPLSTPPHLYASFARHRWAAGLALLVPFGSSIAWPSGWPGRFESLEGQLRFVRAAPFLAWRWGPVAVAGGPHLDAGSLRIARALDFVDAEGGVLVLLGGWGLGAHAAVHWRAAGRLHLGARLTTRTVLRLRGQADFEAPEEFAGRTPDQDATARWTLPDRLLVGMRWTARPRLHVLGELAVTNWTVHERVAIDFAHTATPDAVQPAEWTASVAVRAGVELSLAAWTLRAGGSFDVSPAPPRTLAPSSPDSHRASAAVGVGWRQGGWRADAFYEHVRLLGARATGGENLLARYDGHAHVLGVSIGWSSDADSTRTAPGTTHTHRPRPFRRPYAAARSLEPVAEVENEPVSETDSESDSEPDPEADT